MYRPFVIGLISGLRSLTPIAAVSEASRNGDLQAGHGAPRLLTAPLVNAGLKALAAGELAGDKMRSAPDRIVPAGMIVRVLTASVAGAALADRRDRTRAALIAVAGAFVGAHVGWRFRMAALRRFGQVRTGVAEDLLTLGATHAVMKAEKRDARRMLALTGDVT